MVEPLKIPQTASQVTDLVGEDLEARWEELFAEYQKEDIISQLDDDVETLWMAKKLAEDEDREMLDILVTVINRLRLEAQAL